MTQLILGLGNKARHGKDSFAKAIDAYYALQNGAAAKHGLSTYKPVMIQQHAFADALYKEVNDELKRRGDSLWINRQIWVGPTRSNFVTLPDWVQPTPDAEVSTRAPYGKHPLLLQWWGTEFRRSQDPLYWVTKWKAGINPKANIVLATDMRFINEALAVKDVGGSTVRVSRLNLDGTPFVDTSRDPNHPSEIELDGHNFDYRITVKTGDLVLLEEWAVTLVHHLRALKGQK
jgi:hypothetical protein